MACDPTDDPAFAPIAQTAGLPRRSGRAGNPGGTRRRWTGTVRAGDRVNAHDRAGRCELQAGGSPITPDGGSGSPVGYTPQQIRTAYGIDDIQFGAITGDGAGQTIAIVDAYDDPGLVNTSSPNFSSSDLAEFDQAFGLPDPPSFTKLSQFGSNTDLPGTDPAGAGNGDGNWEYEEAMDVEWAHAIAPAANIILVEANSDSFDDLYNAIDVAADYPGVSTVSLSWGSPEFAGETNWDDFFETPSGHQGVTFVAASGDGGAPGIDPAFSPNVVAAGGTSLTLNSDGSYDYEIGWFDSGGGVSQYEPEPAYQEGVQSTGYRTIPDVSFVSDRSPGVAVYDSYDNTGGGPWVSMGGTSLAAPSWAALIAIADQGRVAMGGTTLDGPSQTLPALYSLPSADFHDITTGYNGYYTAPGYDYVTGLGTPVANLLVPDLASYGMSDQLVVTAQPASSLSTGSSFGLTVAVESPGGQIHDRRDRHRHPLPREQPRWRGPRRHLDGDSRKWRRDLLGPIDRRRRDRLFPASDRRRLQFRDLDRLRRGPRRPPRSSSSAISLLRTSRPAPDSASRSTWRMRSATSRRATTAV